jgi:hypothetical protein
MRLDGGGRRRMRRSRLMAVGVEGLSMDFVPLPPVRREVGIIEAFGKTVDPVSFETRQSKIQQEEKEEANLPAVAERSRQRSRRDRPKSDRLHYGVQT